MTSEQAISILEREFQQSPEDIEIINLLGGEPLSNFQIIPDIYNWIKDKSAHLQTFIRTNGTLLTEEMKRWFAKRNRRIGLGLSIDGDPTTNLYNRGTWNYDLDYFKTYWPDVPLKMTIFPDSVGNLFESIKYLHDKGFNITGGLAQGVPWDRKSITELDKQLSLISDYYIDNPELNIISPLLSLKFEHYGEDFNLQNICWERNPVHTYDCDGFKMPCHMFSTITQGKKRQLEMLKELKNLPFIKEDRKCLECDLKWLCTNCPGLNYQHLQDFHRNINKEYLCECRKLCAKWSAKILISRVNQNVRLVEEISQPAITNALTFYRKLILTDQI